MLHIRGLVVVHDMVRILFVHLFLSRFVIPLVYRCRLILGGLDITGDEAIISLYFRITIVLNSGSFRAYYVGIHPKIGRMDELAYLLVLPAGGTDHVGHADTCGLFGG